MKNWIRIFTVFTLLTGLALPSANAEGNKAEDGVLELLYAQQNAWNRGDIEAFMSGYWRDEKLTFVSGGTMLQGWDATLARYQATYATRALMGELRFEDMAVERLAPDVAMVRGVYRLTREADTPPSYPWGRFTLILRQFSPDDAHGQPVWRIVYDHTSAGEE